MLQNELTEGWSGNAFSDVNDRTRYFHCGDGHCRDEFTAHSHTSTKQQRFCLATRGDFSGKNKNRKYIIKDSDFFQKKQKGWIIPTF